MFRPALVLAVVIGLSTAHWEVYKKVHNKSYSKNEDALRKKIFDQTVERINHHNIHHDLGMTSFRMGLNFFSDLTNDEYRMYKGLKFNASNVHTGNPVFSARGIQAGDIPDNVDWRKKGLVTPVKNQGQCGSCWSFSTTGSVEGQNAKKTGSLTSLSEQQLVDCSVDFGNNGCDGGLMDGAFKYIKSAGGLERENDYPYEGVQSDCRSNKKSFVATVSGFVDIPAGDEDALKKAIATVGPVSIAIDAGHPSFQSYKSGVYDEPECTSDQLDHGVLAVGYGSQDGVDFWLVKNSWDTVWGETGYIKMRRNNNNQCGVASMASYPTM